MVDFFRNVIEETSGVSLLNVSDTIIGIMGIVIILLIIVSLIALIIEIYLAVKYTKYNRKQNSINKTGEEVVRTILDENDLKDIEVKSSGSFLFGNSYSHYFKKVRLRRLTWKKSTISSLAMASEKASLAILDKENDIDMKTRIKLTPIIYFGPLFFVPLVIIGLLIDILLLHSTTGTCTIILTLFGLLFYLLSFIMSIVVLKTEKKAQNKAYEILKKNNMSTDEELDMIKSLFKLYNLEYINNMVIALLELIYRVLEIIIYSQNNK